MTYSIKYKVPESGSVVIELVDIIGIQVKEFKNHHDKPGIYEVKFEDKNLITGRYYYKVFFSKMNDFRINGNKPIEYGIVDIN